MERYIQWLVSQPGAELTGSKAEYRSRHPTATVRAAKASFFATRPVQEDLVRLLERRKDVREYFEKVREDAHFHARELAKQQIAQNFEARAAGLERALDKQVSEDGTVSYGPDMDVKAIEHFTRPFLDNLAFPKKPTGETQAPRVVINIGSGSPEAKALWGKVLGDEEEPEEVDYEIIEQKQLTDGDDD